MASSRPSTIQVTVPQRALRHSQDYSGLWWHTDGQVEPAPAGPWEIRCACVDKYNRVGAWSLPTVLDLPAGWILMASNRNLLYSPQRAAVAWRATNAKTGQSFWLVEGQRSGYGRLDQFLSPMETKAPFPWSSNNPKPYPLTIHDRGNAYIPVGKSDLFSPSPAPAVWPLVCSLEWEEYAWSWATLSGETPLSPSMRVEGKGSVGARRFLIDEPIPAGAMGRYLYRRAGLEWRRQIATPWGDPANPNAWLFGVHDNQPILWSTNNDGPVFDNTIVKGESEISVYQKALIETEDSIELLDQAVETKCPIIDPWKPSCAPKTLGRPVGQFVVQQRCVGPLTYWPIFVSQAQHTTIQGHVFKADPERATAASHALVSSDFSGGQAFGLRARDCSFAMSKQHPDYPTHGVYVGWECCGSQVGQHTASEWTLENCKFDGNIPIALEGTQTVNMRLRDSEVGFHEGESAAILLDGSAAVFTGGLTAGKVGTLFALGWVAQLRAEDVFIDQEGQSLVDYNSYQHRPRVTIETADPAGFNFISRAPVTTQSHELLLRDWKGYRVEKQASSVYACSFNRQRVVMDLSECLTPYVQANEPDQADFLSRV